MSNESVTVDLSRQRDAALCLSLVSGIGPKTYSALVQAFGSPANVLNAEPARLREIPGVGTKLAREVSMALQTINIAPHLELCQENNIRIVDRESKTYPNSLARIYDPPNILYSLGELLPQDEMAIAIVGTRHATHYGKTVAEKLARGLAMAGFTIVSGLARGIDAAAHRGALKAGGRTIAVLGSGVLEIYPPEHKELAAEISHQGAVISEMLPLQTPKSGAFPQRNRIVTGLSLGLIVVEAGQRSGALISARLAMEQDREVFAVPGRIDNRMSQGCHALLRDGAKLVESIDDVIEELGPLATPAKLTGDKTVRHPAELKLTGQQTEILQAIGQGTDPIEIDRVIDATGLPASRVLSTVSVLEIRRLIRRLPGNKIVRV